MAETYDAIVIGAGIIGAALAKELGERGWRTLNLDRLPAAGYGSTGASCAIIRVHYSTVDGAAMAYDGYFYWKDWADYIAVTDERGLAPFRECGCLVMKTEKNGYLEKIAANCAALGIPFDDLDHAALAARLPGFDLRCYAPVKRPDDPGFAEPTGGTLAGALFFPTAGYIADPQLATHNLQRAAEAAGGAFRFNAEVTDIRREGGRVVGVTLADGSRIDAPVVVNVAGPHSAKINDLAGVTQGMAITTRALRQEVAHVPAPAGVDWEGAGVVISDSDIGCYSRPELGNHILIGSEDPECDPREFVDPDDFDRGFTEQWTVQVQRQAQRIPGLPIPRQMAGVVDLYDVTEDWIPIYDASDLGGFYMAIGTSGNQFKNAPVAGALMAELIVACEQGRDHDAEPLPFTLKRIGRTIDTRFYSRQRAINPESSFSVLG